MGIVVFLLNDAFNSKFNCCKFHVNKYSMTVASGKEIEVFWGLQPAMYGMSFNLR